MYTKQVTLIGNYLSDRQFSMQKFALALHTELLGAGWQVNLVQPQAYLGKIFTGRKGLEKWLGYVDKYILFKSKLSQLKPPIHICDQGNAIYVHSLQRYSHLITCHDVMAIRSALGQIPHVRTSWTGQQYQKLILNGLNRAQHVACVSAKTREDLLAISKLKPEQTSVIHHYLNYSYRRVSRQEAAERLAERSKILDLPFVLHIGHDGWYKNRAGLLRIFSRFRHLYPESDLYLLIAGSPLEPELRQLKFRLNLDNRIIEWNTPSSSELEALYSTAIALLFPSLDEGFGLPPLEAQACGCPVVCSRNGALPEVVGDGALMAPADEEEEIAHLLGKVVHSSATRTELVTKGSINVKRFQLKNAIDAYIQLYEKLSE